MLCSVSISCTSYFILHPLRWKACPDGSKGKEETKVNQLLPSALSKSYTLRILLGGESELPEYPKEKV